MSENFHTNFIFSGPVGLEKIFKWPHSIFVFAIFSSWKGILNPFTKGHSVKSVCHWLNGSGEQDEIVTTTPHKDNRYILTRKFCLNFCIKWAEIIHVLWNVFALLSSCEIATTKTLRRQILPLSCPEAWNASD